MKLIAGQIAEPPKGTMDVQFIKIDNDDLDAKNISKQVIISSIRQNSITALYCLISKIYVPLLR
jgi:hypothetical protein